jgi:hypothetical protein
MQKINKRKSEILTRLLLLASVCLISTAAAEIDYEKLYLDKTDELYTADQIIASQNVALAKQNGEIKVLEAKEKSRRILTVPFTDWGITTEHAQGAAVVCLIWLIVAL